MFCEDIRLQESGSSHFWDEIAELDVESAKLKEAAKELENITKKFGMFGHASLVSLSHALCRVFHRGPIALLNPQG